MGKTYTTFEISQYLNVFMSTVAKWIDDGKLNAFRTPGGHRRVTRADLLQFLKTYNMPVPQELIEKEKPRILIVEDNAELSKMLSEAMKLLKYPVDIEMAKDGFEAGKHVIGFKPHLVILDVILPGQDGLQVCQDIRNDPEIAETPVIIITGCCDGAVKTASEKLKIDGFFLKPLKLKKLIKAVDESLAKIEQRKPIAR